MQEEIQHRQHLFPFFRKSLFFIFCQSVLPGNLMHCLLQEPVPAARAVMIFQHISLETIGVECFLSSVTHIPVLSERGRFPVVPSFITHPQSHLPEIKHGRKESFSAHKQRQILFPLPAHLRHSKGIIGIQDLSLHL